MSPFQSIAENIFIGNERAKGKQTLTLDGKTWLLERPLRADLALIRLCLMGERTKKIYRLGDFVKVRCSKVDIPNREIYFDMVEDEYIREEIKASKELAEKISEVKQELKEEDVEETDDNIL